MSQDEVNLTDYSFIQGMVRISLGGDKSDAKPIHHIGIDGLRFFYNSLGKERFKKFIDTHEIYTNKQGIKFVRRKFGKRNALKTYLKLIIKLIKTA